MEPEPQPPETLDKRHQTAWRAGTGAADLVPLDPDARGSEECPYPATGRNLLEGFRDAWLDGYAARLEWRERNRVRTKRRPTHPEFWQNVAPPGRDGCRLWLGTINAAGYGVFAWEGRMQRAHRIAWSLSNGPIPEGLSILHSCDNPPCCEGRHLRPGTQAENMQEMARRGRARNGNRLGEETANAKLTPAAIMDIRARCARGKGRGGRGRERQADVAVEYGVAQSTVSAIISGKTWTHL